MMLKGRLSGHLAHIIVIFLCIRQHHTTYLLDTIPIIHQTNSCYKTQSTALCIFFVPDDNHLGKGDGKLTPQWKYKEVH